MTVPEAAAMLRVSSMTIRRFIDSGQLPAVRVGPLVRIERRAAEGLVKPLRAPSRRLRARRYRKHPRPLTAARPSDNSWLLGLIGIADGPDDGVHDVSTNKYKYLAEEYGKGLAEPPEP